MYLCFNKHYKNKISLLNPGEDITSSMELHMKTAGSVTRRRRDTVMSASHSRYKRQTTSNNIDWGDGDDEDLSVILSFLGRI